MGIITGGPFGSKIHNDHTNKESVALTAMDVQGVVINEILPDPSPGSDIDGNGSEETNDEFVELFNTTGSPVDISGWTITDVLGTTSTFTFPPNTFIPANGFVTVIGDWAGVNPPNVFDGLPSLANGGDAIILSDGSTSATASFGSGSGGDDFGSDVDGTSLSRVPDGGMTIANNTPPTVNAANICFLEGTSILTKEGYINIESLKIDDLIKTDSGKELPIKWLGIQSVDINENRNPLLSNPVKIEAGALAEGVPSQQLYVSPNHAIFVEGLLINAGALVNGVNIIQENPSESFKYYHIELDSHELVIAENTPAESYLPQNENRDAFDNATAFDEMYPEGRKLILWPLSYPRVSAQSKVPQYIKNKILDKLEIRKTA